MREVANILIALVLSGVSGLSYGLWGRELEKKIFDIGWFVLMLLCFATFVLHVHYNL